MDGFVAGDLGAVKASAQSVDLIINFTPSFIQRVCQGWIDPPKLLLQCIKFFAERLSCMFKRFGCFSPEILSHDARHHMVQSFEEIPKPNAIALERAPRVLFDKGETRARQYRRDWALENPINLGCLREVSDLGRASIVGEGRQKIILHYGAQSYVRTKAFRFARSPRGEFFGGSFITIIFRSIFSVISFRQRMARAIFIMQKQRK